MNGDGNSGGPVSSTSHLLVLSLVKSALCLIFKRFKYFAFTLIWTAGFVILLILYSLGLEAIGLNNSLMAWIVLFLLVGFAGSALFNYWIRLTLMGPNNAQKFSLNLFFRSTIRTFIGIIIVSLFVGFLNYVVSFMLTGSAFLLLEVARGPFMDFSNQDVSFLRALFLGITLTWASCYVFSLLSFDFVEVALGKRNMKAYEKGEEFRFSFVLFIIYLIFFIPDLLFSALEVNNIATEIISTVSGLVFIATIGAAHGLAYRQRVRNHAAFQEAITSDERLS